MALLALRRVHGSTARRRRYCLPAIRCGPGESIMNITRLIAVPSGIVAAFLSFCINACDRNPSDTTNSNDVQDQKSSPDDAVTVNDYKTDEDPAAIYGVMPTDSNDSDDSAVRKFLGDDEIPSKDEMLVYGVPPQDVIKEYHAVAIPTPSDQTGTLYGPSILDKWERRINILTPQVKGSLNKRIIQNVAQQHTKEIGFIAYLTNGPINSVTIQFQVTPEGKANNILLKSVEWDTNADQTELNKNKCLDIISSQLQKEISTWQFPASPNGESSDVQLPISIALRDD